MDVEVFFQHQQANPKKVLKCSVCISVLMFSYDKRLEMGKTTTGVLNFLTVPFRG